ERTPRDRSRHGARRGVLALLPPRSRLGGISLRLPLPGELSRAGGGRLRPGAWLPAPRSGGGFSFAREARQARARDRALGSRREDRGAALSACALRHGASGRELARSRPRRRARTTRGLRAA